MQYSGKVDYAHTSANCANATSPTTVWPTGPSGFGFSSSLPDRSLSRSFAHGFTWPNFLWLSAVLVGTGIAALRAQLPGVERSPYILRFDEDRPNPLYRRVCYTFAWNAVLSFALLNLAALTIAAVTGVWYMKQIYTYAYFPLCALILCWALSASCPVSARPQGRRHERRYFYGSVWAVTARPNPPARPLEDPARHPVRPIDQARRLCRRPRLHGLPCLSRKALPHPPHRPRRIHGLRLTSLPRLTPGFLNRFRVNHQYVTHITIHQAHLMEIYPY